jgi:hypothetical protein
MKLYVPEIGDHLRLTEDWHFTLYGERRNESLAKLFGYFRYGFDRLIPDSKIEPEPERNYTINYPETGSRYYSRSYQEREAANKKAEDESPSYQAYLKAYKKWKDRAENLAVKSVDVFLPKGTVLAVDRIYIRKGVSDYSSISFWAKGLGECEIKKRWSSKTKWKSQRFWAKLSDCNKIEFDLMDEKEVLSTFKQTKSVKK